MHLSTKRLNLSTKRPVYETSGIPPETRSRPWCNTTLSLGGRDLSLGHVRAILGASPVSRSFTYSAQVVNTIKSIHKIIQNHVPEVSSSFAAFAALSSAAESKLYVSILLDLSGSPPPPPVPWPWPPLFWSSPPSPPGGGGRKGLVGSWGGPWPLSWPIPKSHDMFVSCTCLIH